MIWRRLRDQLAWCCAAALLGCGTASTPGAPAEAPAPVQQPAPTEDFRDLAERAGGAIVTLVGMMPARSAQRLRRSETPFMPLRAGPLGSGVYVGDGWVLTAQHVVSRAGELKVQLQNGEQLPARLVGGDGSIAVLAIDVDDQTAGITPLSIGDASKLVPGQRVVAVGNPFGNVPTVTTGVVAASGVRGYVVIDAAVHFGNTGGALIDMQGDLVGLVDSIASEQAFEGTGFAMDTATIERALDEAKHPGDPTRAIVPKVDRLKGLAVAELNEVSRARLDFDASIDGVLVVGVEAGSRFERAGVEVDDVIAEIDLLPVGSLEDLRFIADRPSVEPTILLILRERNAVYLVVP